MSIQSSQGQLARAMQELMIHWARTRDAWRDARARDVESRVLEPLNASVIQATRAMERMAQSLYRARRECSRIGET